MKRRTMLKRLGAAGAGMAAVSGSASTTTVPPDGTYIDDLPVDGAVVLENGEVFVYASDADPDVTPTEECCSCGPGGWMTDCDLDSWECCNWCHMV